MSEATQTQTLEQTLNKTDLGHVVYENRKIFFGLILAILIGSTGYIFWGQSKKNAAVENSIKAFEFQTGIWADTKSGKTTVPELIKAFEGLDSDVQASPVMVPVVLEMSKFLYEKGNAVEAETILSKTSNKVDQPVLTFFLSMQRAVVLEKLGKIDAAITVLAPMAEVKDGLMSSKISLELGRLYLTKGEKGKAQSQFEYITNTFPNDEMAKLAKLYLQQMAQ